MKKRVLAVMLAGALTLGAQTGVWAASDISDQKEGELTLLMVNDWIDETGAKGEEFTKVIKQYEEEKAVIPGKILNQYTDLDDQKKIAELFNTTLKISPSAEDRDKALNDIVRKVKEDSIEQQMNATNDILRWQDLIKEKANLAKLHISL